MTKKEKNYYMYKETVAYYSGWNGIEIKKIEYGIDDYIIYVDNAFCGTNKKVHKVKIHYAEKSNYFLHNGIRIPLNECIRCNAF